MGTYGDSPVFTSVILQVLKFILWSAIAKRQNTGIAVERTWVRIPFGFVTGARGCLSVLRNSSLLTPYGEAGTVTLRRGRVEHIAVTGLPLKGHCIEFNYYADGIHSGLTPPV